jgi:Ni2+-binding GTPase involved in maturation of urease and hydrogenase
MKMLASVRDSESRALGVRGEAGVGKTALLESAARINERILEVA